MAAISPSNGPIVRQRTKRKENQKESYKTFEKVLLDINPFGTYQALACFCIIFAQIEWAGNFSFVNIIGSIEPDWLCTRSDGSQVVVSSDSVDKCTILKNDCASWTALKNSTDFNSIVATFKMICDDEDKVEWIQMGTAIAMLIGSVLGGHLGDWYGRMCLFYVSQLGIVITSCMTTAAQSWRSYLVLQAFNGFLYGIIEVESLTLLMEYTNNQYRMIPNACYQWNIANMVMALTAYLTKDWQVFFVFLNLITSPVIMMLMLFHESPRWLVATGRTSRAAGVLNDLSNPRWNGTLTKFTKEQLDEIPHEQRRKKYTFYHLFSRRSFAKQSFMQILSMMTYAFVSISYTYAIKDFTEFSPILIVAFDGIFRLVIPIIVILLDMNLKDFNRRAQFLLSLTVMFICYGIVIGLIAGGYAYTKAVVAIPLIIGAMINDSAFWMNVVQVTTQRYPTVIRCIAFGSLHSVQHIGTIIGIIVIGNSHLLHDSDTFKRLITFIIPEAFILATLIIGYLIEPDTKNKALTDTIDDTEYNKDEDRVPQFLIRLAAQHRVMATDMHNRLVRERKDEIKAHLEKLEEREKLESEQKVRDTAE